MTPKASRLHPYRATSNVETPGATQSYSSYAGPGLLPAGIDPPPDRPILIIVDYSPLQSLAHPSERGMHCSLPCVGTTFDVLRLENWKLLSPGPDCSLLMKLLQSSHLWPQVTTRLRTQWDIHMIASDLEFRYADLTGDVFQVRDDWTIMQLLDEYRPDWRIRQYNYRQSSLLVPGTQQPFFFKIDLSQSSTRYHTSLGSSSPSLPWICGQQKGIEEKSC